MEESTTLRDRAHLDWAGANSCTSSRKPPAGLRPPHLRSTRRLPACKLPDPSVSGQEGTPVPAPDPEPAPSDHELPDRRALQRQLWKRYIKNIVAKKCHENDPETRLAGL